MIMNTPVKQQTPSSDLVVWRKAVKDRHVRVTRIKGLKHFVRLLRQQGNNSSDITQELVQQLFNLDVVDTYSNSSRKCIQLSKKCTRDLWMKNEIFFPDARVAKTTLVISLQGAETKVVLWEEDDRLTLELDLPEQWLPAGLNRGNTETDLRTVTLDVPDPKTITETEFETNLTNSQTPV